MKYENQFNAPIPAAAADDPFPHTHPAETEVRYQLHMQEVARKRQLNAQERQINTPTKPDAFPDTWPELQPAPAEWPKDSVEYWKWMRGEIGPPSSGADIQATVLQRQRAGMSGYRFVTFDEMDIEPQAKNWLIKGIFARGETSAWIAPPGAMKSALLAEATICVAAGLDWHGYRSKGAAGVVYFALERADLVKRRLRAHKRLLGLQGTPIAVAGGVIELTHPEAFKKVIDTMRSAKAVLNADIGMIVIDTFAKLIAAGGGDENSAKDQGAVFANLQRVKDVTGAHVALIGHTGKDESRGMRGSNAAPGDFDLEVRISGDDVRTATVTKANDAPEGPLFSFKSEVHEFGADEDGDPVTVNIVSRGDLSVQLAPKPHEPKLTTNQRVMFRLLAEAGPAGLSVQAWNDAAREQGIASKQRLYELRMKLKDKKLVREYNGVWKANRSGETSGEVRA